MLNWEDIREQHLYGRKGTNGNRIVEVVRAYANEWITFCYLGDRMITCDEFKKYGKDDQYRGYYSYSEAMDFANRFLAEAETETGMKRFVNFDTNLEVYEAFNGFYLYDLTTQQTAGIGDGVDCDDAYFQNLVDDEETRGIFFGKD